MKAFRTKTTRPKVKVTVPQFHFLKKIKNVDFEGYFHLEERGRYAMAKYFRLKIDKENIAEK